MTDRFQWHSIGTTSPGERHFAITPSDEADLPIRPRSLYCNTSGNVAIRDIAGTDITYAVSQGQVFPFRGVRILATGTTATVVGWD